MLQESLWAHWQDVSATKQEEEMKEQSENSFVGSAASADIFCCLFLRNVKVIWWLRNLSKTLTSPDQQSCLSGAPGLGALEPLGYSEGRNLGGRASEQVFRVKLFDFGKSEDSRCTRSLCISPQSKWMKDLALREAFCRTRGRSMLGPLASDRKSPIFETPRCPKFLQTVECQDISF